MNISYAIKPRSGIKSEPAERPLEQRVVKKIKENRSDSIRDFARKFKTLTSMIQRVIARNGYKIYTKTSTARKTTKKFNEGIDRANNFVKFLRVKKNL